jgi:hypothetical protein
LRALAQSSGFDSEKTSAERLRQQADRVQTLQAVALSASTPGQARQLVHEWFQRSLHTPDENYALYLKKRQTLNCEAAAQFHNSTTPEQRAHAVKVLKSYEKDVRELMRTPS